MTVLTTRTPSADVAAILQVQGIGTVDVDLFVDEQPKSPEACVSVVSSGGDERNIYNFRITILIRGEDQASAQIKSWAIYNLLLDRAGVLWPYNGTEIHYYGVIFDQTPFYMGASCRWAFEYTLNFTLLARRKES